MILNSMRLENFKGIKSRQILFSQVTEISGQNGVGKSTVYDAFTWCLFGKDSLGQAQFGIQPIFKDQGIWTEVGGIPKVELVLDGTVFVRELHSTGIKNRFTIDGYTKSITEYKAAVDSLISEETFKTLTDVHYVCGSMHWTARRELLLSLAGEIGSPVGFDDLLGELKGRSMLDFKALCQKEKLRITKARDEIQPRIDEIQRGLDKYAGSDGASELKRNELEKELKELETARQQLLAQESDRQLTVAQVQKLRTAQIVRESFLKTDNSRVVGLIQEKGKLVQEAAQWASDQQSLGWSIGEKVRMLGDIHRQMATSQDRLDKIRTEYKDVKAQVVQKDLIDGTCPTCRQELPKDQIEEIEIRVAQDFIKNREAKDKSQATLKGQGDQYNKQIKIEAETIAKIEAEIVKLQADLRKMIQDNTIKAQANSTKLNRIEAQTKADVKVAPENDQEWKDLQAEIEALTVGESVAEQLTIIENSKTELNQELVAINNTLAQADRSAQDKIRIGELEKIEAIFNDQIMDLEKRLNQIDKYNRTESSMIEAVVNGRFKHVTWRLFVELKKVDEFGDKLTELCCDAVLNGVPYSDLSYGERILVGLDIVNVLAAQYGVTVPLFVDNAESYTPEIEWVGQVIKLIHKKSQKTLKIA